MEEFLPKIKKANENVQRSDIEIVEKSNIESEDETTDEDENESKDAFDKPKSRRKQPHVEMNLGVGVFDVLGQIPDDPNTVQIPSQNVNGPVPTRPKKPIIEEIKDRPHKKETE